MAEEAKDSPSKGGKPPCEYPEGALDLLKKLTEGKPPTRATGGWLSWKQIVNEMNKHFEPVNKMHHPKSHTRYCNRRRSQLLNLLVPLLDLGL